MALLPPTVGERLVRCGRRVAVWGIVPGSDVELLRNGAVEETQAAVSGSSTAFALATDLDTGDRVTARQRQGGDASLESPAVEVGDVQLPPPPPRLPPSVYRCVHVLYADGMAPGSTLKVLQGDPVEPGGLAEIAEATVNRHGWVCFGPKTGIPNTSPLFGRVTTCTNDSSLSPATSVVEPPARLSAPNIHEPLFGCQNGMDMSGLTQGARVLIFADSVHRASFNTCWGNVHVNLPWRLAVDEMITAKQVMQNPEVDCDVDGDFSDPPDRVVPPDARIKPGIRPVLYDGDQHVRVTNQIDGAEITLLSRDSAGAPEGELGRAGASEFEEIALNEPLMAGQILRARQSLCGHSEVSEPITVQPRPSTILAPIVRDPLYDCGVLVPVDRVLPGAQVRVLQNGFPVGFAWASGSSVVVRIGPALVNGNTITARQRVGGVDSALSAAVTVSNLASLPRPTILPPLRLGERSVRVGGIVPGAFVEVFDRASLVGTADTVDTTVTVSISQPIGADAILTARQTLCDKQSDSSEPGSDPHADPSEPGGSTPSSPSDTPSSTFDVPASANFPSLTVDITGELTFPSDPADPSAIDPSGAPYPLVIVAHGRHRSSAPSYQGYRYLTNHLASHGMICMSIDLNDVNAQDGGIGSTAIDTRGLVILEHIRILLARNSTPGDLLHNKIDSNNIALVGHSRGGEGVVAAQVNNLSLPAADRFQIKAVVPIAPTNFLDPVHSGAPLFVIYGSSDADVSGGSDVVNPFFIYDRSETPKAMIFVHNARHNGFNSVWVTPAEENETILAGALSPAQHRAIAQAYINAFFQSKLFNRRIYDVYLQGPVMPLGGCCA